MSKPNLSSLIQNTQDARSNITVLKDSKNISVRITGYFDEDGDVIAKGDNEITGKPIEVKLKFKTKPDGTKTNRSMSDIQEFTPVGTTVIFTNCFDDATKEGRVTSYYARTPFNTVAAADGESKSVNVNVLPGRLTETQSGRVAGVFYNFKEGSAVTNSNDVYEKASELFKEKQGVYLRVRVDSSEDDVKKNEAFEFLPVIDTHINEETKQKTGVVNVEASLNKIKQSAIGKLWIDQLDDLQEYLGKEVNIDLMPILTYWGSAAAFRDGKKLPEQKTYGLNDRRGFFASESTVYQDSSGQQRRNYQNVATNLIYSVLDQTSHGEVITTMLGANALGTSATFTSINNLPIMINGEVAYMPEPEMIQKRLLKSDGTFVVKQAEQPKSENVGSKVVDNKGPAQDVDLGATAKEVAPAKTIQEEVIIADVHEDNPLDANEPDYDGPEIDGMDEFEGMSPVDIASILADMGEPEDIEPKPELASVASGPKP